MAPLLDPKPTALLEGCPQANSSMRAECPLASARCPWARGRKCGPCLARGSPAPPGAPQGVVLQQDSYIEDQKLLLSERALARSSSRPSSLVEQEKQRSLERQRQDLADLQRQQAQHLEERRRREREWEARERALREREARLAQREEEVQRGQQDLERDREALLQKRGAYQCDLERLRAAQKQLEREQEQLRRDTERLSQRPLDRDVCQVTGRAEGVTMPAGTGQRAALCSAREGGRKRERKGQGKGRESFLLFPSPRG